ncbi:putative metallopeptidase [Halopseudomonas sp. SMJS2]|uniref:putative metallopeptidase n=1 Tax=Halopseudomonas sp. SMJS2 TaxID=3041098 RepID=UPI002452E3C7|nr:putative metallopeptidase [Halopseudomonas sp. SMJS2]WGK60523.1 putative metallopeptidase [Halopseudomonas sp. SMJS2]
MRPSPPASLTQINDLADIFTRLVPAPNVWEWIQSEVLAETGSIHNPDHAHLLDADIEVMWASTAFAKKGRSVIGQAEQVAFRAGGWQKARMEQQMRDWFGRVPAFIITLAADYCSQCSDADFLRLVEHELMHIAHATDQYGAPKFTQEGMPKLFLRGHDVSEFVSIVERYGVGHPEGDLARMVEAAKKPPSVSRASIASACGTCLMRSA